MDLPMDGPIHGRRFQPKLTDFPLAGCGQFGFADSPALFVRGISDPSRSPGISKTVFPRYAGGRYDFDGSVLLVSRGLARESTRIPRLFNRPELMLAEIVPSAEAK